MCGSFGVTGERESACWSSIDCADDMELRNRWGPLGPSTCCFGSRSKTKARCRSDLGVCASSYVDRVVKLGCPDCVPVSIPLRCCLAGRRSRSHPPSRR